MSVRCFRAAWICAALLLPSVAKAQYLPGDPLDGLAKLRDYHTRRESSSDPDWKNGNADSRPIPPGGTLVLADIKGPGVITSIWNTVASRERGYSRLLVIRIYWDGAEHPSVEAPLGDFFAMGHGQDLPVDSLPVRVTSRGRARNCYWPMPFRESAKITLTNEGVQTASIYFQVNWQQVRRFERDVAYFHAQYRQEFPTTRGRNYLVADIVGRGHYIGTVLSCRSRAYGWWGEGDDFFFIDGEREPSIRGTGTEDYFSDAWGFRSQSGMMFGAPLWEGISVGSRTTAYRWHITDPITFQKSLRFEIEHKGSLNSTDGSIRSNFEERADDFSSVAFWYQSEPHKPFPPMPVGYERLNYDYRKMIEGENLTRFSKASDGSVVNQPMAGWSGNAHIWWRPLSADQSLTLPMEVKEAGSYDILFLLTRAPEYGIYQVEINGRSVLGPIDLYSDTQIVQEYLISDQKLEAGTYNLVVKNRGRNPLSSGYHFGLDGYLLIKR